MMLLQDSPTDLGAEIWRTKMEYATYLDNSISLNVVSPYEKRYGRAAPLRNVRHFGPPYVYTDGAKGHIMKIPLLPHTENWSTDYLRSQSAITAEKPWKVRELEPS